MLRALLKAVLVLVILVGAAAFLFGWWTGGGRTHPVERPAIGTSGHVDTSHAREVGARVGEKTAEAANRAEAALSDGALTAKIKSKMALDDLVQAGSIDVTTKDGVVTLNGAVRSTREHERAVQLAKETAGVKNVIDKLR